MRAAIFGLACAVAGWGLAGAGEAPPKPFGETRASKPARAARVTLGDGSVLRDAAVTARAELDLLLFVGEDKTRVQIPWAEVTRIKQTVESEGVEREWRWKEGGANEKIYTGRTYPWRSYRTSVIRRDGKILAGQLTQGFSVEVTWRPDRPRTAEERAKEGEVLDGVNQSLGSTMTPEQRAFLQARIRRMQEKAAKAEGEPTTRSFILTAKSKGEVGQTLAELAYVKEIDFTPGEDEKRMDKRLALLELLKQNQRELEDLASSQAPVDRKRVEALQATIAKLQAQRAELETDARTAVPPGDGGAK